MYAIRKSDKVIVVKKQANKVIVKRTAESVERRTLTKRNSVTALVVNAVMRLKSCYSRNLY